MFTYCCNNPVSYVDPNGEFGLLTLCLVGAFVGAVLDYGMQVCSNYANGKSGTEAWTDVNVGQIASAGFSGAINAVPGGGLIYTAVDVVGGAVIEEGVNALIEGRNASVEKICSIMVDNVQSELISTAIDFKLSESCPPLSPSLDMPTKFSDIKSEARLWFNIKGTNKLNRYLNMKQGMVLGYNLLTSSASTIIQSMVR